MKKISIPPAGHFGGSVMFWGKVKAKYHPRYLCLCIFGDGEVSSWWRYLLNSFLLLPQIFSMYLQACRLSLRRQTDKFVMCFMQVDYNTLSVDLLVFYGETNGNDVTLSLADQNRGCAFE